MIINLCGLVHVIQCCGVGRTPVQIDPASAEVFVFLSDWADGYSSQIMDTVGPSKGVTDFEEYS